MWSKIPGLGLGSSQSFAKTRVLLCIVKSRLFSAVKVSLQYLRCPLFNEIDIVTLIKLSRGDTKEDSDLDVTFHPDLNIIDRPTSPCFDWYTLRRIIQTPGTPLVQETNNLWIRHLLCTWMKNRMKWYTAREYTRSRQTSFFVRLLARRRFLGRELKWLVC